MDFKYTIIDSDATSNLQLQHHLEEYGDFFCIGHAKNREDGMNFILKHNPDLVFINLTGSVDGYFHMVSELHQYMKKLPILIAISKNKQHAYEAIKSNFFDYWLTPYNEFDIRKSLLRLQKQMPEEKSSQTLCLKSYNDFRYLDTDEILYLKADNNATDFIMKDGSIITAFKTLKTFEERLPKNFIRVHQSYILNSEYVSGINYGKSVCALKSSKQQLPFSKSYRDNVDGLKKALSKNTISALN